MQSKKVKFQEPSPSQPPVQPRPVEMQEYGTPFGQLKPRAPSYQPPPRQQQQPAEPTSRPPEQLSPQPPQPQQHMQNQIDPNLFSLYTQDDQDGPYQDSSYPYPGAVQTQPYHPRPQSSGYNMPSLEQIASECLVDLNGPDQDDVGQTSLERNLHLFQNADTAPMTNGDPPKPDESVDSAISLPATEPAKDNGLTNGHVNGVSTEEQVAQPSVEPSDAKPTQPDERPQSSASISGAHSLPLYQPPAPVSQSPEVSKRRPVLTNGASHGSPSAETNGIKRKRDSSSATPNAKKARLSFAGGPEQAIAEEGDDKSVELAKALQQQDRGLRRRSQA